MDRRAFNKVCTSLLAGAASLSRTGVASDIQPFPSALLVDQNDKPLTIDTLSVGSSHVFSYPYVTTPCFLIRLNPESVARQSGSTELTDRAGNAYQWQGGAGADHSLVAFSAICTHKMSHPAKPISHLNFRAEEKEFRTKSGKQTQSQIIMCCSEHSIYDPGAGARVLSGPATQPLAAIALSVTDAGQISATGSYGGNMYDEFLAKFGFRLAMESGVADPKTLIGNTSKAIPAEHYSRQQIKC